MHILFTRPFDDCHELMLRFKSLGHMVSHIPVISIQKIIYESLDFSLFKGIIFTSSNAIKFLDELGNPYSKNLIDADGTISISLGAYGVPESFLLNNKSIVIRKYIGPLTSDNISEIIKIIQ